MSESQSEGVGNEEIWLLGQPPLSDYLDFVKHKVENGATLHRAALTQEWQASNRYYQELEDRESGIADRATCNDLDPALTHLADKVKESAWYRRTFDTLPTSFGMVELDRLIVFQKWVSRNFIDSIKSQVGPVPDPETLFHFCLPTQHPGAPVQIRRVGSKRYLFCSDSTDFRYHESVMLRPEQIMDHESIGPIAGVVGLVVGFGSNFLNVIRVDNRVLLHNGYHRACALRALGVTHAPCIIQTVACGDELEIAAKRVVAQDPDFYFRSARPPLLKDFFDPRIRKILPVCKQVRMIEVNFEVREHLVPE